MKLFIFFSLICIIQAGTLSNKTYNELKQTFISVVNCRDSEVYETWRDVFIQEMRQFNIEDIDHSDFQVPDLVIVLLGLQSEGRHSGKVAIYLNEINKCHDGLDELQTIYSVITTVSMDNASYLDALRDLVFGGDLLDSLYNYFSILHERHLESWSNYYQAVLIRFGNFSKQLLPYREDRDTLIRLSKYPNPHFISYILSLFCGKGYHVFTFIGVVLLGQDITTIWQFYSGLDIDFVTISLLKKDIELIRAIKVFEQCKDNGLKKVFEKRIPSFINVKAILI
jgi:hypothetical protein